MTSPTSSIETADPSDAPSSLGGNARNGHFSEEEFLEREAADAKAALDRSWRDLRQGLRVATDVRSWAKRYPLPSVGAALGAGLVAGLAVGAPRRTPEQRREADEKKRRAEARRARLVRSIVTALLSVAATNVGALLRDSES
jgi:hypothetical protein